MSDTPQVRARYMATYMEMVAALGPEVEQRVRGRMDPRSLEAIEAAGVMAWLPARINLDATAAVAESLEPAAADRFFRSLYGVVYDTSLLSGFVRSVIRLFGRDPGGYAKMVSRAYPLIFRGVGQWARVDRGEHFAVLRLFELPPEFAAHEHWPRSVAASLGSMIDLARCEGEGRVVERGEDFVVVRLEWTESSALDESGQKS